MWLGVRNEFCRDVVQATKLDNQIDDGFHLLRSPCQDVFRELWCVVCRLDRDDMVSSFEVRIGLKVCILELPYDAIKFPILVSAPLTSDTEMRLGTGKASLREHLLSSPEETYHRVNADDILTGYTALGLVP